MMPLYTPAPETYDALVALWEASVRATHDFLLPGEIDAMRGPLRDAWLPAVTLRVWLSDDGRPLGFVGVAEGKVEMLFVAPDAQGQGIGRHLLRHAVLALGARALDVNEQNPQALAFYQHLGFEVTGRSPLDGQGRPYPLLHLALQRPEALGVRLDGPPLTVWGRRSAFNVQKVLWLVGELGLPYEHHEVGGSAGGLDTPAFLTLNPHGRIPVIRHGAQVVWESHTILRYLAAQVPAAGLWVEDAARRAEVEGWMDWQQTTLQRDFLDDVFAAGFRLPPAQRDPERIAQGVARCGQQMRLLDAWLARRAFLAGEHFSLADIAVGTTLYRYFTLDIARPAVPHVEAWYDRLQARAAYREHVMLPYGALAG